MSPCAIWIVDLLFAFLLISSFPTFPKLAQFQFNFDHHVPDAYAANKYLLFWIFFTLFFKFEMMKDFVSSLLFQNDSLAYSRKAFAWRIWYSFIFVCRVTTRGRGWMTVSFWVIQNRCISLKNHSKPHQRDVCLKNYCR